MEFGSKYVYNYSDSEEESVSDDEFEAGIDESCKKTDIQVAAADFETGGGSTVPQPRYEVTSAKPTPLKKLHKWMFSSRSVPSAPAPSGSRVRSSNNAASDLAYGGKRWRRADTNVVAVKFDQLTKPANMHTGDAVSCTGCRAMLSHISKITQQGEEMTWICEFCGDVNVVDLLPAELPNQSDVTYMIKPAALTTTSTCQGVEESLVVFCIDTSGSMCVSQEVEGRLQLRGNHADRYRSLNTEGSNQWMPGQNHNVTYITRLQALQAAVDHQLEQLAKEHPSRKVVLITFSTEVTIIGDGTMTPVIVAGDKLNDFDELSKIATSVDVPARIQASRTVLSEKVFDLEEGGQTALGPALLVAVTMASKVAGSKVVMCTDGLANVGLGNLDNVSTDQFKIASEFYSRLGETARDNGVTVSVLTIAGTECKLVELGSVASTTGGQVNIVDPLKLTQEFGNILANPIIASRVVATFIVHKGLYIRNQSEKMSCITCDVGNVTKDTEITFEYGVRRRSKDNKKDTKDASEDDMAAAAAEGASSSKSSDDHEPSELPFQVQIQYTDLDGAEAMRVLTKTQEVTKDRTQAETYINVPVIGCTAAQKSSNLALEGHYTPSRLNAFMYQRLLYRNSPHNESYEQYCANVAPLERNIRMAQISEASSRNCSLMSYEDMDRDEEGEGHESPVKTGFGARVSQLFTRKPAPRPSAPAKLGKTTRRQQCPDSLSSEMYRNRSVSSKAFTVLPSETLTIESTAHSAHSEPTPKEPVLPTAEVKSQPKSQSENNPDAGDAQH